MAAEEVFGPDLSSDTGSGIDAPDLDCVYFSRSNERILSFLPISWRDALGGQEKISLWRGCEKWWAKYPVIFWFQLNTDADGVKGTLFLYAELGPLENHNWREKFIKGIGSAAPKIKFGGNAVQATAKYSKFFKNNSRKIGDVSDTEALTYEMQNLLNDFKPLFEKVSKSLREVVHMIENSHV